MRGRVIWVALLALYAVFWLWYTGVRGPLTAEEIEAYVERMAEGDAQPESRARLRAFLESDTGDDFVMVNAILMREKPLRVGPVRPDESSSDVLDRYMAYMTPALLSRASHPVVAGRAAAPAVEVWGLENGRSWSLAGLMRYRSRRDLMEIATDPRFRDSHEFKIAAIEKTIAFPIDPYLQLGDPRLLLALLLFPLGAGLGRMVRGSRSRENR